MHALFFEVRPLPGHLPHYFEHVARLKPELARHNGLAFLDRYGAVGDADLLLSHQLWETEQDIAAWRADSVHRASQAAGRHVHFADYRIRVAERVVHWQAGIAEVALPAERQDGAHVLAIYGTQPICAPGFAAFESVNHAGQFIALTTADGLASAQTVLAAQLGQPGLQQAAVYRVLRDYGMFDRAQAPR